MRICYHRHHPRDHQEAACAACVVPGPAHTWRVEDVGRIKALAAAIPGALITVSGRAYPATISALCAGSCILSSGEVLPQSGESVRIMLGAVGPLEAVVAAQATTGARLLFSNPVDPAILRHFAATCVVSL